MGLLSRASNAIAAARGALADPSEMGAAVDQVVAVWDPERALRRTMSRVALTRAYEAATPSRYRKWISGGQDGNATARGGAPPVREQARHLQRNHDIARGILRTLTNFVVGAQGIQVEPQPRILGSDRDIHPGLADEIDELWREWCRRPEVSWTLSFAQCQRLAFSSLIRDGEVFGQTLEGFIRSLDHGTEVPFSLELIEADHIPMSLDDPALGICQGIECNEWQRPRAYHVYRKHPGSDVAFTAADTKRVSADRMLHVKLIDRIGQLRGVSEFASIITRLEDVKDYEESERIAAKIAASMAAVIKKGEPSAWGDANCGWQATDGARELHFRPGMIFDDLQPGEDVSVIDSKRPNTGLGDFIAEMNRRLAAGAGASYSSVSKNYNGTYSSQRQELVESYVHYSVLAEHFTAQFVAPTYRRFINAALLSGRIRMPSEVDPMSLDDAIYQAPAMPWIDPVKEATANQLLEESVHDSGPQIIRRAGRNPREVLRQERRWRGQLADMPAHPSAQTAPPPEPEPDNVQTS